MQLVSSAPNIWEKGGVFTRLTIVVCSIALSGAIAISYNLGGIHWLSWQFQRQLLHSEMEALGNGALDRAESSLSKLLPQIPIQWVRSMGASSDKLPMLILDIKFKHMRKIYERREQALERGILIQQGNDFVPGSLRFGQRTVPIKMRLKGDWTDHLEGNKWSFRVHARKGNQILGMRRFSLQHPKVRGYQSEIIYLGLLRKLGVLAPRYKFVNVILNGNDLGIMALEEHFSKELLESQSRREGVILRFDEGLVWAARDGSTAKEGQVTGFSGVYDDFRNATVDAFRLSKISESPKLSSQYNLAVGLLRAFVADKLAPSKVFDADTMGKYLALTELLGTKHPTRWHNQRYYFNPITLLLEPIGFDADLQNRIRYDELVTPSEPLVIQILNDSEIWASYQRSLQQLISEVQDGSLIARIEELQSKPLNMLRQEFFVLQSFPAAYIRQRAEFLSEINVSTLRTPAFPDYVGKKDVSLYPKAVHANHYADGHSGIVDIHNAIPWRVEVQSITYNVNSLPKLLELNPPLSLAPRIFGSTPVSSIVGVPGNADRLSIKVVSDVVTSEGRKNFSDNAALSANVIEVHPIAESTVAEVLAAHDFIERAIDSNELVIKKGEWRVEEDIVIPKYFSLKIEAGTTLLFSSTAGIISHGPLNFAGTSNEPIKLLPEIAGQTWPGIVVLRSAEISHWNYVMVDFTRNFERGAWQLTGGVNFYDSAVEIESSHFSNHAGEDALNIISSSFSLTDSNISNAASDGFDCDFCTGEITGGELTGIAGDGFDFSMSEIQISGTSFRDIADKALSIGEGSAVRANTLTIENCGTGAAAKDGSVLLISDTRIVGSKLAALMAYVKKPEFGIAKLEARNVVLSGNNEVAFAQTNSIVSLNGIDIPARDIDVDKLYETVMKPSIEK